ncbi:MAG: VOC family protein [Pseudomonadota bacterium]|nr:VOC family protein [Pseudomonadota bacterium]
MAIVGTDHTVMLVQDIEAGITTYRDHLGLELSHTVEHTEAGISQAFFAPADGTFLELIAPSGDNSRFDQVLNDKGEGVHVLALAVDDLDESVAALQQQQVQLIGVGTPQVFIHPRSAHGVMIQLWPKDRPHRWRDSNDPVAAVQQ